MSGTVVGVVDAYINTGSTVNNNIAAFVNIYNYFQAQVAAGQAALVASNYGLGASGFDFHTGTNPVGENAFAVFQMLASASTNRTQDYYVMIQWADASLFGSAPGNPGTIDSGTADGVAVVVAYKEDGTSPWNGTTNADGADTKGTPVWSGTGLHVLDAQNETGAQSANKENLLRFIDISNTPSRLHIVGDGDMTFLYVDSTDDADSEVVMWFGAYEPLEGLTIAAPFIFARFIGSQVPSWTGVFDTTGNYDGQMTGYDVADGIQDFSLSEGVAGIHFAQGQPSNHGGTVRWLDFPIYITQRTGSSNGGTIGQVPAQLVSHVFGAPANTANAALDRAVLGASSVTQTIRYSVAWGGSNPPGTNGGFQGISI